MILNTGSRPRVSEVERGSEHAEGEGSDAEGHVEALSEAEAREAAVALGLGALPGRPRRHLLYNTSF